MRLMVSTVEKLGWDEVSKASNRPEHVIPELMKVLQKLNPSEHLRILRDELPASIHIKGADWDEDHPFWESDLAMELMMNITDELNNYAPHGYYFGAHEGNSSLLGFHPNYEEEDEEEEQADPHCLVSDVFEENYESIKNWVRNVVLAQDQDPIDLLEQVQKDLSREIEHLFLATNVFGVNNALPGCMPDCDPDLTVSFEDAKDVLKSRIHMFFNLDGESVSEDVVASVNEAFQYIDKHKDPVNIDLQVEGEDFWIAEISILD